MGIIQEFLCPGSEFTPFPFWFLNGDLREDKIERQLKDFKDKGISGAVLHPRIGIPRSLEYLSDAFMDKITFAVKTAKRLDMKVLLYDEGMYPSGSAHGKVVNENPEYAAKMIRMLKEGEEAGEGERIHSRYAVVMTGKDSYKWGSARILTADEDIQPGETEIRLACGFSKGTIRGLHEEEDDGERFAPKAGDLLNRDAMQAFIRLTHNRYYERMGEEFGDTIIGFFTDEPSPVGRCVKKGMQPWTEGFDEELVQGGFDMANLPALWLSCCGRERAIRALYDRIVCNRMIETYYRPISDWCKAHSVALCGHPHAPQDSSVLTCFQIPGQDIVWRWVAPENDLSIGGNESAQAKCASDIARHMGARRNLNECFGCCGPNGEMWAFNADDMKWYLSWLFVRGCNMILPHAFYYEVNTPLQIDRPPDAGPNNIWWPHYSKISDYIKRMSLINTDGVNQAKVAVLATGDKAPVEAVRKLYENQIEFNYLTDDWLIKHTNMKNGRMVVGRQEYEALLLSDCFDYNPCALSKISDYKKAGLKVYHMAGRTLERYKTAHLSGRKRDIRVSYMERKGEKILLLFNEGEKQYSGDIKLPFSGDIAVMTPWTGAIESAYAKDGNMHITLGRREMKVIANVKAEGFEKYRPHPPKAVYACSMDAKWTLLLPDGSEHKGTGDWREIDAVSVFSGTLAYTANVALSKVTEHIEIDLGDVREMAEVFVNGKMAGALLAPPYRMEIGKYLHDGANEIKVLVTNSLVSKYENKPWISGMLGGTKLIEYERAEE